MVRSTDVKVAILNLKFWNYQLFFFHFNLHVGSLRSLSLNRNSYVNLREISDPSENLKIENKGNYQWKWSYSLHHIADGWAQRLKEEIESVLWTVGSMKSKDYFWYGFSKIGRGIRKESAEGEPKGAAPDFCFCFLFSRPFWFIPLPAGGGTSAFSMVANHTTKYYKLTQAYYNKEQSVEKHHSRDKK